MRSRKGDIVHTIRLRRAWERSNISGGDVRRVEVPDPLGDVPFSTEIDGGLCYKRSFNMPTGLQPRTSVFLNICHWRGRLEAVKLNDRPMELSSHPWRCEVSSLLRPHNRVEVHLVTESEDVAQLDGEVMLEIVEPQTPIQAPSTV